MTERYGISISVRRRFTDGDHRSDVTATVEGLPAMDLKKIGKLVRDLDDALCPPLEDDR